MEISICSLEDGFKGTPGEQGVKPRFSPALPFPKTAPWERPWRSFSSIRGFNLTAAPNSSQLSLGNPKLGIFLSGKGLGKSCLSAFKPSNNRWESSRRKERPAGMCQEKMPRAWILWIHANAKHWEFHMGKWFLQLFLFWTARTVDHQTPARPKRREWPWYRMLLFPQIPL